MLDRFAEWYRRMRREPELWCDWKWIDAPALADHFGYPMPRGDDGEEEGVNE